MLNDKFLSYSQQVLGHTHWLLLALNSFFSLLMIIFNLLGAEVSYSTVCCQELIKVLGNAKK